MTAQFLAVVSLAFLLTTCSAGKHLPPSERTDKVPASWMSGDFNNVPAMSSFFGVDLQRVSEGEWSTLKPTGPSGIEAITVRREPQVEDRFNNRRDNGDFVVSFNDHACFEIDAWRSGLAKHQSRRKRNRAFIASRRRMTVRLFAKCDSFGKENASTGLGPAAAIGPGNNFMF